MGKIAENSHKRGGGINRAIIKRCTRLLPLVAFSQFLVMIISGSYYALFGEKTIVVWPIWQLASPWRFMIGAFGMETGWIYNHGAHTPTWFVSVLILCNILYLGILKLSYRMKAVPEKYYFLMIMLGIAACEYEWTMPLINVWSGRGFYSFFYGLLLGYLLERTPQNAKKVLSILSSLIIAGYLCNVIFFDGILTAYGDSYIVAFFVFPATIFLLRPLCNKKLGIITLLSESSFCTYIIHTPMILLLILLSKIYMSIPVHEKSFMYCFLLVSYLIGIILHTTLEKRLTDLAKLLCNKVYDYYKA